MRKGLQQIFSVGKYDICSESKPFRKHFKQNLHTTLNVKSQKHHIRLTIFFCVKLIYYIPISMETVYCFNPPYWLMLKLSLARIHFFTHDIIISNSM